MALFRKLTILAGAAEVARRYARKHPDKINKLAGQAGRFVDKRTKGKYHSQIDGAVQKVRAATDRLGSGSVRPQGRNPRTSA